MQSENSSKLHMLHWIRLAAVLLFLAVALGAFGAHGLEKSFSAKQLDVWEKGVDYLFIHGLAILLVSLLFHLLAGQSACWQRVNWSFLLGVILFSGSLFVWSLTDIHGLVFLTPIGGVLFLAGWMQLIWGVSQAIRALKANA